MKFLGNHAVTSSNLAQIGRDFNANWGLIQSQKMIHHLPLSITGECLYYIAEHNISDKCFLFQEKCVLDVEFELGI